MTSVNVEWKEAQTGHSRSLRTSNLTGPSTLPPIGIFAKPAARAAECAEQQGAFRAFLDLAYAKQDSLGVKSWGAYAAEAGIADTSSFAACARSGAPLPRVYAGLEFGERINVRGTPTVLINGWRYPYTPSLNDLEAALEAVRSGKEPKGTRQLIWERER